MPADDASGASSRPERTLRLVRGARRLLGAHGVSALPEFNPKRGLRVDLFGIARDGEIWVVEVKSGLEDYRADQKWRNYLPYCDRFYFCVGLDFPLGALPGDVGVIQADQFGGEIVREAQKQPLAPARRKALTIKAARDAAYRLARIDDPGPGRFAEDG